MGIMFYPHEDDLETSSIQEKLETLMEAAERYKAIVLDVSSAKPPADQKKRTAPRDLTISFNWEEMAKLLREIRDLPEATSINKLAKANFLEKLAEIYEVLRAAKMTKLEAVRIALVNEANQLKQSAA
jgi:hypothetical protein